jgi:hypothetical protein
MNSIRQFNKETLNKTNRIIEDEKTRKRNTSRDLFCLPLQDNKSDQNNQFDKEIRNITPELEESISKIQYDQNDYFDDLTFSEISLFLQLSVDDQKIGDIKKSISIPKYK